MRSSLKKKGDLHSRSWHCCEFKTCLGCIARPCLKTTFEVVNKIKNVRQTCSLKIDPWAQASCCAVSQGGPGACRAESGQNPGQCPLNGTKNLFNVLSVVTTANPQKSKLKFFLPTWMLYTNHNMHIQKMTPEWVRFNRTDGSSVKSTGCSSRRPGFNSQHPCSSTKLSVALVPGDPTHSHGHTCRQNNNAHEIRINYFFKRFNVLILWVRMLQTHRWYITE